MSDEVALLNKLSQPASPGKSRDSKEVPVGREIQRRKRGRKGEGRLGSGSDDKEDQAHGEPEEAAQSGKVLDITV